MKDIETVESAMREAFATLADVEPGPRSAEVALKRMMEILDRKGVKAARERLSKGYGLRVIK
jgi:hypothetical protein